MPLCRWRLVLFLEATLYSTDSWRALQINSSIEQRLNYVFYIVNCIAGGAMTARLLAYLILAGLVLVGLASAVASIRVFEGGLGWGTSMPAQGPSPNFFIQNRAIHPPCMGQTGKFSVHTYAGNKP